MCLLINGVAEEKCRGYTEMLHILQWFASMQIKNMAVRQHRLSVMKYTVIDNPT